MLSLPLAAPIGLPAPFAAVRLPELLFVPALALALRTLGRADLLFFSRKTLLWSMAAIVALGALQWPFHAGVDVAIEIAKTAYGIAAGLTLAVFFRRPGNAAPLLDTLYRAAAWYAAACIVVYAASWPCPSIIGRWVAWYADYPGLGDLRRAVFLTDTPTMLGLFLALVWLLDRYRAPGAAQRPRWMAVVILAALALTFSKTIVLLLAAALWVPAPGERPSRGATRLRRLSAAVLVVLELLSTHAAVVPSGRYAELTRTRKQLGAAVLFNGGGYTVVGTTYLELKNAAVRAGLEHPWTGLGAGRFPRYQVALQRRGLFPAHIPDYDPHATPWGAFAEGGWPGLAAVVLLYAALARAVGNSVWPWAPLHRAVFLLLALESLHTDLLHVRIVWVFVALLWAESGK